MHGIRRVVVRSQDRVHLLKEALAESFERAILWTIQLEPDQLHPGESLLCKCFMEDDLRIEREDALEGARLADAANAKQREALDACRLIGGTRHKFGHGFALLAGICPVPVIQWIPTHIPAAKHAREPLFEIEMLGQRLEELGGVQQGFHALYRWTEPPLVLIGRSQT